MNIVKTFRYAVCLLGLAVLFSSGCKDKDTVLDFSSTATVNSCGDEMKSSFIADGGKWVGALQVPGKNQQYVFYCQFKENGRALMYSDYNATSATTASESSWLIECKEQKSYLVFYTSSYLQLPTGATPDYKFLIEKQSSGAIKLTGEPNGSYITLQKANTADFTNVENGALGVVVSGLQGFFQMNSDPFAELSGGTKLYAQFKKDDRQLVFQTRNGSTVVTSQTVDFYYTAEGLSFINSFSYNGTDYVGITFSGGKPFLKDAENNLYEIKTPPQPPLNTLFAFNGTYNKILITGETLPVGVTSGFNAMFATMVGNFHSPTMGPNVASIAEFWFRLTNATTARVNIKYTIPAAYDAWADYDYTISGDIITLGAEKATGTYWSVNRSAEIGAMKGYFANQSFKIDWVTDANGNKTLGGLYPVSNPSNFFYGTLTK